MSHTPAPSASSSSSTAANHSAQAASRGGAQGAKKPAGQETGTDLFANLLSLLSASNDALPAMDTLPVDLASDGTDPAASDNGEVHLEAMMAWAALPTGGAPTTGTSGPAAGNTDLSTKGSPTLPSGTEPTPSATGTPLDELPGMQALEQPEALDEQTLASLSAPPADARPTDIEATPQDATALPSPAAGAAAARPGAWRSTAQMASTSALQQWHHSQAQTSATAERVAVRVDPGAALSARSTLALDQRFTQASIDESPAGNTAPASALGSTLSAAAVIDATGQPGSGGEMGAGADSGEPSDSRDETRADSHDESYEEALAEADAQDDERLDSFASPQLRQASLRIGEDSENAIDVKLSLNGQELDLSFRTDSAETRAELRQNAEGALTNLLQREGIQLGDVSVSDQGGQHSRDGAPAQTTRTGAPSARPDAAAASATDATPPLSQRRNDGSRPLDLFV